MRILPPNHGVPAGVALLAMLLATVAPAQSPKFLTSFDTADLGDGLYTFRYGPYRNIFLIGDHGVIVTDPIKVEAAAALRSEIRKLTDLPVTHVAYSHSHWDHAKGGRIFKDEGAQFVAQQRCLANIRQTPRPDLVPPDVTFDSDYTISAGSRSLELYYFGPSHSDCLAVMIARPADVLFVVDIANPPSGWHLEWNPTAPDTHFYNLVPYLAAVEELVQREGIEKMVGGHITLGEDDRGRPVIDPPVGSVAAVTERRMFWETLIGAVEAEMATGTFGEHVFGKLDHDAWSARLADYDEREMAMLVRRIGTYVVSGR